MKGEETCEIHAKNELYKRVNRISTIVFHTKGGTAEVRVDGTGNGWQSSNKIEKQQHSEAYSFHADNPRASRLTPEPPALSVAGPFSSLPIKANHSTNSSSTHFISSFCFDTLTICTLFHVSLFFSFLFFLLFAISLFIRYFRLSFLVYSILVV